MSNGNEKNENANGNENGGNTNQGQNQGNQQFPTNLGNNPNPNPNPEANQLIPANANKLEFGEEIQKLIATAGTLDFTERQKEILAEKFKDEDVYIKPDGLIYLTWVKYAIRLNTAFGGGGWTMIPQGMPKMFNNNIIWGFHLVVKGAYCGFAIGEQEFFDNKRMSYGEGCEGAKSNALVRLCKGMGIGLELWDKGFIDRWLNAYADKKWDEEKRKYKWFLKPGIFNTKTGQTQTTTQTTQTAQTTGQNTGNTQGNGQNNQGQGNNQGQNNNPIKTTPTPSEVKTAETTTTATTTPVKETPVKETAKTETPAATKTETKTNPVITTPASAPASTPASNKKTGYTGAGKKSKLPENSDFLKQPKDEVPLVPMTEEEVSGEKQTEAPVENEAKFNELKELVEKSHTTGNLKMNYETTKKAQAAGQISEAQKEVLRKIANQLFVKLASQGK